MGGMKGRRRIGWGKIIFVQKAEIFAEVFLFEHFFTMLPASLQIFHGTFTAAKFALKVCLLLSSNHPLSREPGKQYASCTNIAIFVFTTN